MPDPTLKKLDPAGLSKEVKALKDQLESKILGQDRAVQQFVNAYQSFLAGMSRPERPAGAYLFLGPTGVGKTETVKQVAYSLFRNAEAFVRVDCAEFSRSHEVAKLLGSPPGYVGFKESNPRLSQATIDQWKKNGNKNKPSIVLFDEIEKAHPSLFDTLLSVLDSGKMTLGDNSTTNFTKSIIFCTSNLGSSETKKLISNSGMGFGSKKDDKGDLDEKIYRAAKKAVEKHFRPEFINRFDRLVVFRALTADVLEKILDNEIWSLEGRLEKTRFKDWEVGTALPEERTIKLTVSKAAREFILAEGTSDIYGARELNRAVEKYLAQPLASFLACQELQHKDHILVDKNGELSFTRKRTPPNPLLAWPPKDEK